MDKQELLSKELYTVVSMLTEMPHLMDGKFFVVFSDEEKAARLTRKLNDKIRGFYRGEPIKTCLITDCDNFFTEMIYSGFPLFLYDGIGQIHNLSEIYGIDFTLPEKDKEVYTEYMGYLRMTKSLHIGKVKQINISNAEASLNSKENKGIVDKFIEKQKSLKQSYKDVSVSISNNNTNYTVNTKVSAPFPPTLDYFEKHSEEKQSDISEVTDDKKETATRNNIEAFAVQSKDNMQQTQKKKNRPVVAVVMFVLSAFFAVAFIGAADDGDIASMWSCGITAIACFGLGIAMRKMYLKQFVWSIAAVFLLMGTVICICDAEPVSTIVTGLIMAFVADGIFVFVNRNSLSR